MKLTLDPNLNQSLKQIKHSFNVLFVTPSAYYYNDQQTLQELSWSVDSYILNISLFKLTVDDIIYTNTFTVTTDNSNLVATDLVASYDAVSFNNIRLNGTYASVVELTEDNFTDYNYTSALATNDIATKRFVDFAYHRVRKTLLDQLNDMCDLYDGKGSSRSTYNILNCNLDSISNSNLTFPESTTSSPDATSYIGIELSNRAIKYTPTSDGSGKIFIYTTLNND